MDKYLIPLVFATVALITVIQSRRARRNFKEESLKSSLKAEVPGSSEKKDDRAADVMEASINRESQTVPNPTAANENSDIRSGSKVASKTTVMNDENGHHQQNESDADEATFTIKPKDSMEITMEHIKHKTSEKQDLTQKVLLGNLQKKYENGDQQPTTPAAAKSSTVIRARDSRANQAENEAKSTYSTSTGVRSTSPSPSLNSSIVSGERGRISKTLKAVSVMYKRSVINEAQRSRLKSLVLDHDAEVLNVVELFENDGDTMRLLQFLYERAGV
jgi:hypothetical protein